MGEECPLGLQARNSRQRMFNRRVRGVRLIPQRIQKQNIQPFQLTQRFLWNVAMIGQVSARAKAETVNLGIAMNEHNRFKLCSEKLQHAIDRSQLDLRQAAEFVVGVKNISKHATNKLRRIRVGVERQPVRLVLETEWAQIVDSKQMIGMRVRVKHRVQASNI